jgi:endonuclease III
MASSKPGSGTTPRSARAVWPPERKRVTAILRSLDRLYPEADCELHRDNPFQLLCATILSAQCTDQRVNQVTPLLFARFPSPAAMAMAPPTVLEELIHSTGFFRNKTKSLIGASRAIVECHGGQVPRTMDELCALPGVARKTANVVLGTAFGLAEGIVVDTHVQRLTQRLALTRSSTPEKIEQDLMTVIPREWWIQFAHQMIWHGRRCCLARRPDCEHCPLAPQCPSAFQVA